MMNAFSSRNDERRARLLNALPAIAWSASAHTFRFNYINPAAEALLGYPTSRWLDEPDFWVSHIHPDDQHVAKLCHTETVACRDHELVYRMVAADGRSVWLRDYVNVHSVEGEPVELFGVMVDITREREAEEASRESRENFRRMVELSPDCIGVSADERLVYVNQSFIQLLGAAGESEVLGSSIESFIHDEFRQISREHFSRLQQGESVRYFRNRIRRVDGALVDVEVAAIPLRYGSRDAVQIIARDITDRIRAENELQVREARLQLLSAGTHEAIWEWFPERKALWTNDVYRQLLGGESDPDTFLDHWLARVHPDDRETAGAVVRKAIEDELPIWWHEYRLRQTDGSDCYVLDRGHIMKSPSGERRVIGAMLDVTPLRESERMRAAAEEKFRWLVEQSVLAVYMMSGKRLTYINDIGAAMFGYAVDELTAIDPAALLAGDEPPEDVFGGGPNTALVRRKDGTLLHVAFFANEVVIDGEPIIIGTAADVTESVRARQALEASEQRYRRLVDDLEDMLFTLDEEGRFTSLSPSFERLTGCRTGDWLGRPFPDLFRAHAAAPLDLDGRAIREYELPSHSGGTLIVEVSSQPHVVDGVVVGSIGMARDVTEHRITARKLEDAKRLSSLGQVAASLAHEFNNVLMGIQPFVEIIANGINGASGARTALEHITLAVSRGKRASQEILRFANPKEPQLFPIDVRTWLPSFLAQLSAALPPHVLLTHAMDGEVGFIRGDREQLEQVITNLVFNARDAIAGSGRIHVAAAYEAQPQDGLGAVRISVSDDGCGIPPQVLDRIFEPLFTTKRNGTGLGLAIARRLMEQQGGTLTAGNQTQGSVFQMRIPAAATRAHAQQTPRRQRAGVVRLLLVEDDSSVGFGLQALLTAEGFETTWVRCAAEVADAARRSQPEVAIVDVNLPDGNGVDLVPVLRAENEDLPIVLSTGHVELSISETEKRLLALMKPYQFDDLLTAIGNVTAAA